MKRQTINLRPDYSRWRILLLCQVWMVVPLLVLPRSTGSSFVPVVSLPTQSARRNQPTTKSYQKSYSSVPFRLLNSPPPPQSTAHQQSEGDDHLDRTSEIEHSTPLSLSDVSCRRRSRREFIQLSTLSSLFLSTPAWAKSNGDMPPSQQGPRNKRLGGLVSKIRGIGNVMVCVQPALVTPLI